MSKDKLSHYLNEQATSMEFIWVWTIGDGTGSSPIAFNVCAFAGPCATAMMRKVCRATRRHTPSINRTTAKLLWPQPVIRNGPELVQYLKANKRNSTTNSHSIHPPPIERDDMVDNVMITCATASDHDQHPVTHFEDIGGSALHVAAQNGMLRICTVLVDFDADVLGRDAADRTPLHNAAYGGHVDVCKFLLHNGADVMARDGLDLTPLMLGLRRRGGMSEELSGVLERAIERRPPSRERIIRLPDKDKENASCVIS